MVWVTVAPGRCMIEALPDAVITDTKVYGKGSDGLPVIGTRVISSEQRRVMGGGKLMVRQSAVALLVEAGTIIAPEAAPNVS
jgi:hypothetical protein